MMLANFLSIATMLPSFSSIFALLNESISSVWVPTDSTFTAAAITFFAYSTDILRYVAFGIGSNLGFLAGFSAELDDDMVKRT